jgi:hypothetical protein
MIATSIGEMPEAQLEKREGVVDNENEYTTWLEYWFEGELVRRDAHVTLKHGILGSAEAGTF